MKLKALVVLAFLAKLPLAVIGTADSGMGALRAAIASANTGDSIEFAVSGTISLGTQLDIGTNFDHCRLGHHDRS